MKKFIVETYYTCTFKTVHKLKDLNEKELAEIDSRNDGEVEVIDVKLNNRKTKKVGDSKSTKIKDLKSEPSITKDIAKTKSTIRNEHRTNTRINRTNQQRRRSKQRDKQT